ncbi:MAG: AIR synthase-related protein, partial [bacterium]
GSAGRPAPVPWDTARRVQRLLVRAAAAGWLSSAHDCSDGGFLVALAECCVSGADADEPTWGCDVALRDPGASREALLFGEAPSRVLVSFPALHAGALARAARGIPWGIIGSVKTGSCDVTLGRRSALRVSVAALAAAREAGAIHAIS